MASVQNDISETKSKLIYNEGFLLVNMYSLYLSSVLISL